MIILQAADFVTGPGWFAGDPTKRRVNAPKIKSKLPMPTPWHYSRIITSE
jgi:hypothetical protein